MRMDAFALTGNIGCGKSAVVSMLSKYPGIETFDCDRIAKEIITLDSSREAVRLALGFDAYPNGTPDFPAIARTIFSNRRAKENLERFIHPRVWNEVGRRVSASKASIKIVESAIIFETNSRHRFKAVITVTCFDTEQIRRLREYRGMSEEEIIARMAEQLPSYVKERGADIVISTDCDIRQLEWRVAALYHTLQSLQK